MLTELEETFAMVCTDEGKMPNEKLSLALQALGLDVSESYYEDLIDGKSSSLDFDVFLGVVNTCMEHANFMQAELQESFCIFDKDRNGSLDAIELKRVFTKLGETLTDKEMEDQIREFDVDGDGEIVITEWARMVASTRGVDFVFEN